MPRLTHSKAKATAIPTGGDQFIWCSEVRGFGVRTTPNGARSYVVQTRINGKPVRKTLGPVNVLAWEGPPDAPGALDLAKLAIGGARRGTDMAASLGKAAAQTFTLGQLWDAYVAAGFPVMGTAAAKGKLKRPTTIESDKGRWSNHVSKLADKPVAALTNAVVARWRDGLKGSVRDTALLLLLALLTFGKSRGLCVPPEPITVKAGRSRKVQNYLTVDELRRFDAACIELAALQPERAIGFHATRVVMRTGTRKSEILSLRRDLTDLDRNVSKLAHDKANGDEGRDVHLSDEVVAILRAMPIYGNSPYFFPGRFAGHFHDVTNFKNDALAHAGLKQVRVHDLRHSFASAAISNGVSLSELGKLLGHKDAQSTQRYAHLADEAVRRAADKVANVLTF